MKNREHSPDFTKHLPSKTRVLLQLFTALKDVMILDKEE